MKTTSLFLEQSLPFQNLAGTSQILIPGTKTGYHFKNRLTHVYEVSSIGDLIAKNIGFKQRENLRVVCLAHDLGHSPFGHAGQRLLNQKCKDIGIKEGFSDNNNNLNVIFNNNIELSYYEQVSLIKYPKKLYEDQKIRMLPLLNKYIKRDQKRYGTSLTRTMACEIMDVADEIAYGISDIFDGFANDYNTEMIDDFLETEIKLSQVYKGDLILLLTGAKDGDKRLIREGLLDLKIKLIKNTYFNSETGKIEFKSNESRKLLDKIIQFNFDSFIHHAEVLKARSEALKIFDIYIDYMFTCDEDSLPSKMYKTLLKNEDDELKKLKIRRDMIADSTDQYVLSFNPAL